MKRLGKKVVAHKNTLSAFCVSCYCLPITCKCSSTSHDPTGTTFQSTQTSQIKSPSVPFLL